MTQPRVPDGATFYLCDFDGTVAIEDVGNAFFTRFIPDRAAFDALLDEWFAGTMGGRAVLGGECALARVTAGEAQEFALAHAGVDPTFAPFIDAVRERGGDAAIASDGLLVYIRPILAANGLAQVTATANEAVFDGDRMVPRYGSPDGEGCGRCGNCKGEVLARLSAGFARTVFIGDGLSDRCGAAKADVVYAKGDLLDWCAEEGIAAREWRTFDDVARAEGFVAHEGKER